jgi:hypothetical protein
VTRTTGLLVAAGVLALLAGQPVSAKELKVISDKTVGGFGHIESIAYDPKEKVLYTGDFGADLKPGDKDGKGKITKVSLDGKILEEKFLPAEGQTLNKPKGIWIRGNRMWFTDIDAVWQVDLRTKQTKKVDLPGAYANDPAVIKNVLYVSDNKYDVLYRIEPANFLKAKTEPKVEKVVTGKNINPNGIWPTRNGSLLLVGFKSKDEPRGIYSMRLGQEPKLISPPIGLLDGVYELRNGDLLVTDWVTNSLFQWNEKMGVHKLVGDIKGPADFCVIRNKQGLLVVLPDLVKGEMRFIQLSSR